jgi:hypothetical protein
MDLGENSLQIKINKNTWLLSQEGEHFYLGQDDDDYIKIISEMYIYNSDKDLTNQFVGTDIFFSENKKYGIVYLNDKFYLFKQVEDKEFKFSGQLICKETVPF